MIAAYYIGFALGGLFFALPDTHGRKQSLIFGLILATVSQTVMILSSNYWVRFAMFGLSGLSQIKNSVSYVWLSECTSRQYKTRAFTMMNIFDSFPLVFICLWFLLIGKNWVHIPLFFCLMCYVALIAAILCPESPRWLLINGKSEQAIKALNKIARMNKSTLYIEESAMFVEDPTNIKALAISAYD